MHHAIQSVLGPAFARAHGGGGFHGAESWFVRVVVGNDVVDEINPEDEDCVPSLSKKPSASNAGGCSFQWQQQCG